MKSSFSILVIAVLLGASIFGGAKALELLRANEALNTEMDLLAAQLDQTRSELTLTKNSLQDTTAIKIQLGNELDLLKDRHAKTEEKLNEFHDYALLLRQRLVDVAAANEEITKRNKEIVGRMMRLDLENQEMRKIVSTEKGLKEALRDLKKQRRKAKSVRVAPVRVTPRTPGKPPAPRAPEPAAKAPESEKTGNSGYLMKNGQPTWPSLVDIRVMPAEE